MVRVLAKDLGTRGITVNAIAPSAVDTPLFRCGKPPQMIKWIASLNPQNRIPLPDDISPMVGFLVSEEARWVNGQTIGVNGVSTLGLATLGDADTVDRLLWYNRVSSFGLFIACVGIALLLSPIYQFASIPASHRLHEIIHGQRTQSFYNRCGVVIYSPGPPSSPRHAASFPLLQRCGLRVHPHIVSIHPPICIIHRQCPHHTTQTSKRTVIRSHRGNPRPLQIRPPVLRLDEQPARGEREREVAAASEPDQGPCRSLTSHRVSRAVY